MENYTFIDMFDKLDPAVLEGLHMEKDLGRHQTIVRRLQTTGHTGGAAVVAVIGLLLTGMLLLTICQKKKSY